MTAAVWASVNGCTQTSGLFTASLTSTSSQIVWIPHTGTTLCPRVLKCLIPATVVPQEAVVRAVVWLSVGKIPVSTQVRARKRHSQGKYHQKFKIHSHLITDVPSAGSLSKVGADHVWHDWCQESAPSHLRLHLQLRQWWESGIPTHDLYLSFINLLMIMKWPEIRLNHHHGLHSYSTSDISLVWLK